MEKKTVAIIYGFGEGPKIGLKLIHALEDEGYDVITDPAIADFVIVHSGGVFSLPQTYRAQKFLFVGVTHKFEGSMRKLQWQKIKKDFKYAQKHKLLPTWSKKTFWNVIYILKNSKKNITIWDAAESGKPLLPILKNTQVLIINYENDPWSGNITQKDIEGLWGYKLLTLDGVHDDLWYYPSYYVQLLKPEEKKGFLQSLKANSVIKTVSRWFKNLW